MLKLPARSCIYFFFSVTACISTQGLCLFTKEITRPEKLFRQMWSLICVRGCETCHEVKCQSPVSVSSWPLLCCHTHRSLQGQTGGLHLVGLIFRSF